MIAAASRENRRSETALESLPAGIAVDGEGRLCLADPVEGLVPFHAGRLRFDAGARRLEVLGVLPDVERDRVLRATAPRSFAERVEELQTLAATAPLAAVDVGVTLDPVPPDLDLRYSGIPEVVLSRDPATGTLRARARLTDRDVKAILVAGSDPTFRRAMDALFVKSAAHAVSPWWLFWFYILSTLGELCLSPVGLSMVSKLAPARYATMLMGLWFLTTFLGNFVAGAFGEAWNTVAPGPYFWIFVGFLGVATLVLFAFRRKIAAMMHGVN
jgi:POT family proton-dependent oligopeptide transporter